MTDFERQPTALELRVDDDFDLDEFTREVMLLRSATSISQEQREAVTRRVNDAKLDFMINKTMVIEAKLELQSAYLAYEATSEPNLSNKERCEERSTISSR